VSFDATSTGSSSLTRPTRPALSISSVEPRISEPALRISRSEAKWLIIGSLAFALIYFSPLFFDGSVSGAPASSWLMAGPRSRFTSGLPADGDRDVFMQLGWVPYYTLKHFHQFPFWSPYKCGGMSMIGNPEGAVVTPFILPYLLFGVSSGVIIEIYLHLALMFTGGYLFGRELGLKPLACITLAGMLSSSWLSIHIGVGHLNVPSIAYVPWVLAMLLASCRTKPFLPALVGGLLCGLTLTEGNYGFVFAVLLVAIVAMYEAAYSFSFRPLIVSALTGGSPFLSVP
jgi:hypothetical protein